MEVKIKKQETDLKFNEINDTFFHKKLGLRLATNYS